MPTQFCNLPYISIIYWKLHVLFVNVFPYLCAMFGVVLLVNFIIKSKVKCTLVQALRLCTGRTAHRGNRGIPLPFHDHGTRRGWGVSVTPQPLFTPRKDLVPIVQEAGWAPGLVWTGAENLTPTRIWSLDRPAHSQSLYRLRYSAQILSCLWYIRYLLQWCWFPICVFIWVAEWQLMHIVDLISTGDGRIMETLYNVGIKLFVLAAL